MMNYQEYIDDCKFTTESLLLIFDNFFSIKDMAQSELVNFKVVEQHLRSFMQCRMEPIKLQFKRANLSDDQRIELGSAIADTYEFFEGQLAQLTFKIAEESKGGSYV